MRIRPLDVSARAALDDGAERSAFFRSLVGIIESSDVIVYIRTSGPLVTAVHGQLQFAAAVDGARYLRITLRCDLSSDRLVALLGHELMHAVEVAREPRVRDGAAFRALYMRIGHSADGRTFDTREAVAAAVRVLAELVTGRSGNTVSSP